MDAIAGANRAVIDGYTEIAKHHYEQLKDLLLQLRSVRGDRDVVVKELRGLIARAKKDIHKLQKAAKRTNSTAQKIVKKRADENIKAWKKLAAEVKDSVAKKPPVEQKKAAPKKKSVSS